MLLEFAPLDSEEQQNDPPQEGETEGEADFENLPECPNHHPAMFVVGKPQSILSLPLFFITVLESSTYGFIPDALSGRR
jgi:hypothetical protein